MGKDSKTEVYWHEHKIGLKEREEMLGQKACLLWFTGLPSSGKSTIAGALENKLYGMDYCTYVLDGDNIRHGLNSDLGFSDEDREENIRRVGHLASLFVDAGLIVISAFISPFAKDRELARKLIEDGRFMEVFIDCNLQECIARDPKGLYKKALNDEIPEFTGISSPYERPEHPEITLKTDELSIEESVDKMIHYLEDKGFVSRGRGS